MCCRQDGEEVLRKVDGGVLDASPFGLKDWYLVRALVIIGLMDS